MASPYGAYGPKSVDVSSLKDKSVIVTGGASGLGLSTATCFASAGAYVTLADIQDSVGEKAAAGLVAKGYKATYAHCDITDWNSSVAAFRHAANFALSKTIDVAALYAGVVGDMGGLPDQVIAAGNPTLDAATAPAQPTHLGIHVNMLGTYDSSFLALHFMQLPSQSTAPKGAPTTKSLILMASMAGYYDAPHNSDYNSSKFGVRGLFRCLRHSSEKINVRVNLLAPYWVDTPMSRSALPPDMNVNFASSEHVVDAAVLCAVNEGVAGRAFAIVPEGYCDLRDDEDGGWGGDMMRALWRLRRSKGDLIGLI